MEGKHDYWLTIFVSRDARSDTTDHRLDVSARYRLCYAPVGTHFVLVPATLQATGRPIEHLIPLVLHKHTDRFQWLLAPLRTSHHGGFIPGRHAPGIANLVEALHRAQSFEPLQWQQIHRDSLTRLREQFGCSLHFGCRIEVEYIVRAVPHMYDEMTNLGNGNV